MAATQTQTQTQLGSWMLEASGDSSFNHAEVTVARRCAGDSADARMYETDVPEAEFAAMLKRAAAHPGYSATAWHAYEVTSQGDVTLSYEQRGLSVVDENQQPQQLEKDRDKDRDAASSPLCVRVTRKQLVSALDAPPGLLMRRYNRARLPVSEFPCEQPVLRARHVRRLTLRVHRLARLVFETEHSRNGPDTVSRSVRVEVDVGGCGRGARMAEDLQRTVQNTVHVVLLGMRPLHAPRNLFQLGLKPQL
jgi:hypothetical protein